MNVVDVDIYCRCEVEVKELKGVYFYFVSDVLFFMIGLDLIVDGGYCFL